MNRVLSKTQALVAAAIVLALIHNLDELRSHEPGAGFNIVATVVLGGLLVAFADRLSVLWRGLVLSVLGLNMVIQGTVGHLLHIVRGSAHGADWSGILFVGGGLILLGLGVVALRVRLAVGQLAETGAAQGSSLRSSDES